MSDEKSEVVVEEQATDVVSSSENSPGVAPEAESKIKAEIDSADVSKFGKLNLPEFSKKIGFGNPVSLNKLKRERATTTKKLDERQLFYFMKDGQRYLVLDPNIIDLKDSCSYVACLLNLCDLFKVQLVECKESIATTTKPISNELINLLYALPLAVYALTQDADLTNAKKSILRNILIIEHFALRAQGEIYNRKYTKYNAVKSTFISNYLEEKCSPFQKQIAMCIRNIIMQECKDLAVDKTTVIQIDDRHWTGYLPRNFKETFEKSEQQMISVIAKNMHNDELNIDRNASLKEQSEQVANHLKDYSSNKNKAYLNQIIELAKSRRKAVSQYFPVQNPNKLKKVRYSLLFDEFKSRKENYEYLNILLVVPNDSFIAPPLSSVMDRKSSEHQKVHESIKSILGENLANALIDLFFNQKEIFNSLNA